jgi:hypothetical protein
MREYIRHKECSILDTKTLRTPILGSCTYNNSVKIFREIQSDSSRSDFPNSHHHSNQCCHQCQTENKRCDASPPPEADMVTRKFSPHIPVLWRRIEGSIHVVGRHAAHLQCAILAFRFRMGGGKVTKHPRNQLTIKQTKWSASNKFRRLVFPDMGGKVWQNTQEINGKFMALLAGVAATSLTFTISKILNATFLDSQHNK